MTVRRAMLLRTLLVACVLPAAAVPARAQAFEHETFWHELTRLCGQAFAGRALTMPPADSALFGGPMVMHVRMCTPDEIRIPLHVGEDRSRTWVVRRTHGGLELKHIHRHEDGTEDTNTNYGGHTTIAGSPYRQEFPADEFSVAAVAARSAQWWFLEIFPGSAFAYGLFRPGTELRYRFEFDLRAPVPPPPPPWGES